VDWLEAARGEEGPVYLAIVRALERALAAGALQAGDRLPPQRAVAERLGVDLTTVTRAYTAARERGLVEGAVGRGTFVRARAGDDEAGRVDLSMNLPPPPLGLSLGALLKETAADILGRTDAGTLMAYHAEFGTLGQRAAGARWLAPVLGEADPADLLVAPGAQTALAATLATLCRAGDTVLAEPLTYPGFIAAARHLGLRVIGCPSDRAGLLPDGLAAVWARERPKALYLTPTMQNPTATTLGDDRRAAVAGFVAARGGWIVEDDPYSRLLARPGRALAALAPGHVVHIATLSKCLSPGLRIAYVAAPAALRPALTEALRAIALMPAPLMAAVATRWITEGTAERLLGAVRAEARARQEMARAVLPAATGDPESIHLWLPIDPGRSSDRLRATAQDRGLSLVTAEAFAVGPDHAPGVRLSLGAVAKRAALDRALRSLAAIIGDGEARPSVMV